MLLLYLNNSGLQKDRASEPKEGSGSKVCFGFKTPIWCYLFSGLNKVISCTGSDTGAMNVPGDKIWKEIPLS